MLFTFLFSVFSQFFRTFISVPMAWILAATIATCIEYALHPKPRVGFIRYFLGIQVFILFAVAALWLIPQQLEGIIPTFWAYSLPAFLLFTAIYFVPPLKIGKTEILPWKWILGSAVGAVLHGLVMSYL